MRSTTRSTPSLLNVEQAAERLGVSVRFVRRLVNERRIAFHKVGKFVRFDPADLDRFVADGRVEPYRGDGLLTALRRDAPRLR